jgi:hypothetical protein
VDKQFKYNSQTNVITWVNGSEILLKDLFQYPSDSNFDSLGSLEITGAMVDECNQCVHKAVQIVKSRMRYKLKDFAPNGEKTSKLKVTKYENINGQKIPCEWRQSDGVLTTGLMPKLLMTCNPAKNWVYSEFYNPSINNTLPAYRKFIQALPADNPYLPSSYVDTLNSLDESSRKRLLEGLWDYDDNPYAMFEYADILGLFTNSWVQPTQERYMTCDIAYTGSDKFVIIIWAGLVAIKIIAIDKIDDTLVSKKINELRIEYKVPLKHVIYDADGLMTFTRQSTKTGFLAGAIGFNNNGKPLKVSGKTENYKNLKTQCYYYLSDYARDSKIFIQDKVFHTQITQELEQINARPFDDDGTLQLEKKDAVRERLKRSPDFADCLMLRMYFEVKGVQKIRIIW